MRRIEERLHPDEPWFTLRGQDLLAPIAVQGYASLLRAAAAGLQHGDDAFTGPDERVVERLKEQADEADNVAIAMMLFQSEHLDLAKLPD